MSEASLNKRVTNKLLNPQNNGIRPGPLPPYLITSFQVVSNASSYSGGATFKSGLEDRLILHMFCVAFISPPRQMPGYCLKLGDDRFLLHISTSLFIIIYFHSTMHKLTYSQRR
jgi:hypothetical protein